MPYRHGMPEKKDQMLADAAQQFRAVVHVTTGDGVTRTRREGPYTKPSTAKARITFWKNKYENHPSLSGWKVDGDVEVCDMKWRRV